LLANAVEFIYLF